MDVDGICFEWNENGTFEELATILMIRAHYTAQEAKRLKGKSDFDSLAKLTEDEINEAAGRDPDNPPITLDELKQFKRAVTNKLVRLR